MLSGSPDPARPGVFTVSLDFEFHWGVRDHRTLESYSRNLLGVREVVPRLLEAFSNSGIRATWATVGFLFFDDRYELLAHIPEELPSYRNGVLSPYPRLKDIGPNESKDPFHFGRSLIRRIMAHPGQEVGSHTFSHYYCLENGQSPQQFKAAQRAAGTLGLRLCRAWSGGSTVVDRMGLYLIPLQLAAFGRLPTFLARGREPGPAIGFVLACYTASLFVWLNLGNFAAELWLPYRSAIIGTVN